MKKIFLNIFILLTIYPISNSICSGNDINSCIKSGVSSKYHDYCCYLTPLYPQTGNGKCITVPYSAYFTGYNREYIDGILYRVNCTSEEEGDKTFALEQCGDTHNKGKSLKDCKKYSTLVDSCCYFSGNFVDDIDQKEQKLNVGCYWLGSKYNGKINWAGAELECHHKYLNYSLFYFSFIILSMIIFF